MEKKYTPIEIPDWNRADDNGTLHIPDELDELFNKVGNQILFVQLSGKSPIQTTADIVHGCQKFFKEMYQTELLEALEAMREAFVPNDPYNPIVINADKAISKAYGKEVQNG